MNKYTTQSQANRVLAAGQTHGDMHAGGGVIGTPSHDAIAHRAYDIFVKDGRTPGHCQRNWLQAEHELHAVCFRA